MLERFRSQPWMVATVVLAIGLVVSLVMLFTQSPSGGETPAAEDDQAPGPTTTSMAGDAATTTPANGPTTSAGDLLSVVVDNAPAARPQVGIGGAALLVEYPVEGGITRFSALVPGGTSGLIGPVRSLRPVNTPLLSALTTAVVSSGGQPFVVQDMSAAGLTSITPDVAPGFVSLGRPTPHDTFIDLDLLAEVFATTATAHGLPPGDELPTSRRPGSELELPYGGVSYVYEQGEGYLRHQDGAPFQVLDPTGSDLVDLRHDILVILSAAERSAGYQDSNGAPVSTFDVIGSGDLLVLTGGEAIEGTWSRSAQADPFEFADDTGEPFGLPGGSVYLGIVPREAEVAVR